MKKILLIIAIVLCIFQMAVAYTAIDIGSPAIDRTNHIGNYSTIVNRNNPANADGVITSVEIYAESGYNIINCVIATFFVVSGNYLSTRDYENVGSVHGGSKTTKAVNIDVHTGDYLGLFIPNVDYIEKASTGGQGVWTTAGNEIPCTSAYFDLLSSSIISLYGTGITIPDQVTNVQATDGTYTDRVRITWDAASGADKYYVWQGSSWVDVGLVTTWDHTGAPAPTITVGTASASDGTSTEYVTLSITGESANNGSSISYKVKAWNSAGYGPESASNSGYRGVGALTYQWQRSAGDSDANYSNIDGATTDPYNDTGAPANGDGRYYKCIENATGATQQTTNSDRGYRDIAVGWDHKWNTQTISKWNTKETMKWNDLE